MTRPYDLPPPLLQFYLTAPYPCSYLDNQMARSQVASPATLIDAELYGYLVHKGFRRSGIFTYRPLCDDCQACWPSRVPADLFQPSRSQRRAIKRHSGLRVQEKPLAFNDKHYALYQQYQRQRHPNGGMDEDEEDQYAHFLLQSQVDTRLVEFLDGDRLAMVSVIDVLTDGLSSVYTFFETESVGTSYGVYNILWQIERARDMRLPYLYLGYLIENCRKMAYKKAFQPLEVLRDGRWTTCDRARSRSQAKRS